MNRYIPLVASALSALFVPLALSAPLGYVHSLEPVPIQSLVPRYSSILKVLLESIANDPDLNDEERAAKANKAYSQVVKQFEADRADEYALLTENVDVDGSCTTQSGTRDCGPFCSNPPVAGMELHPEKLQSRVINGANQVRREYRGSPEAYCMTFRTSSGRKFAMIRAWYVYTSVQIDKKVESDSVLFQSLLRP